MNDSEVNLMRKKALIPLMLVALTVLLISVALVQSAPGIYPPDEEPWEYFEFLVVKGWLDFEMNYAELDCPNSYVEFSHTVRRRPFKIVYKAVQWEGEWRQQDWRAVLQIRGYRNYLTLYHKDHGVGEDGEWYKWKGYV